MSMHVATCCDPEGRATCMHMCNSKVTYILLAQPRVSPDPIWGVACETTVHSPTSYCLDDLQPP